ncbi:CPBP family intramembrane glutamic endopeptidase [Amycolatopsis sp.]|uniref:CPBP family intramembrane glutamic endopeptidase n=1 Tax=Amycolatopsis sp. TaxID=37632 RepID=UPI002B67952D|nr:CPBP family intramembrane glutamic endopeptidase [Amycolatopsis sp.]HVV14065.1 CPBP family intramembrane glutamic endopeptidase [Amycolatopsis sp.]
MARQAFREDERRERRLSVWGYAGLALGYLVIAQGLGALLTRGLEITYAGPTSMNEIWRDMTVPIGVALCYVAALVTVLRWWRPVWVDEVPVARWVAVVPVAMVVASLASTDYGALADRGLGFTLLLLLSVLFVGFAEEGMFRGIGITALRRNGCSEAKVALWSSVVFGLAHASNLINTGPRALLQVVVTALAGYFLYLVRRRSGGLLVPGLVHGLWDFSLISSSLVPGESYLGPVLNVLAVIVLAALLYVRRRRITVST